MTESGLLRVRDLSVHFRTRHGLVKALNSVDLDVEPGQCRVLVGESGSGKSVLIHAILGLLPANTNICGSVMLAGRELLGAGPQVLTAARSELISFIPQSPSTALNPVRRVGPLLSGMLNRTFSPDQARHALVSSAATLGLDLDERWQAYPHQLSGGMQQRALSALALAREPKLVLADEPTSGLDASRVASTADQLSRLVEAGAGAIVVTHDLGLARRLGGRLSLVYGGRIVEERPTEAFFAAPAHPYGTALLNALPERGAEPIPGMPPSLTDLPAGCCFAARCSKVTGECHARVPELIPISDGAARCVVSAHR
ncbi:MAG: ABC transporter ATP-binding protein [Actinomycetota bacterium]